MTVPREHAGTLAGRFTSPPSFQSKGICYVDRPIETIRIRRPLYGNQASHPDLDIVGSPHRRASGPSATVVRPRARLKEDGI